MPSTPSGTYLSAEKHKLASFSGSHQLKNQNKPRKSHLASKRASGDSRSSEPSFDQQTLKRRSSLMGLTETPASPPRSGTGKRGSRQEAGGGGGGRSRQEEQRDRLARWKDRQVVRQDGQRGGKKAGRGREGSLRAAGQRDPGSGWASGAVPQLGGDHG